MKVSLLPILVCGLLLGLSACSRPEPIRIGLVAGLTGKTADLGEASRNGALLAAETINQQGGIAGRPVELIVKDDAFAAEIAEKATRELIAAKVDLIVGPVNSGMAKAMLPLINEARLTTISPTVTGLEFHGKDDYLFRLNLTTRDNARLNAEHHFQDHGKKRLAVIFDLQNRAFSESWLSEFRTVYTQIGGAITQEVPLDTTQPQGYLHAAQAALQNKADGILLITPPVDTARLVQQLRQLNRHIALISSEWGGSEQLLEMGGRTTEGLSVVQAYDRDDTSIQFQRFREAYQARFKQAPSYPSVASYDALLVIAQSLAKRTPSQSVKEALLRNGPYQILQQQISFDAFGDTQRKAYFTEVKNGQFKRER